MYELRLTPSTAVLTILLTYDTAPKNATPAVPALVLHRKLAKFGCTHSLQHFAGVGGVAVFSNFFASDRGRKTEILTILENLEV